jgi:hypothetical protein
VARVGSLAGAAAGNADVSASRILLIEGIPGIGKSTLANALEARYAAEARGRSRSFLRLGQAHTHWPAAREDGGGAEAARACIAGALRTLEWMAGAVQGEREPYFWCLVDTLHLTLAERPGGLAAGEVHLCDARLARLGGRMVLLTAREATVRERCIEGRAGNPWLEAALVAHGGPDGAVAGFLAEQRRMLEAARRLRTPTLVLAAEESREALAGAAWRYWAPDA